MRNSLLYFLFVSALFPSRNVLAQSAQSAQTPAVSSGSSEDLAKATQNPVASLISVPVQNNTNFGIGPYDRNQDVLNIQPVIPIQMTENWNLIVRWIAPIIWQPAPGTANLQALGIVENTPAYLLATGVQNSAGVFGFGDMQPTFFFAPSKPKKVIWGAGPAVVIPTATNKILGQGKLSLGPSIVVLAQPGHWSVGFLTNNVWSVAGSGGRTDVNQMLLQYFLTYNMKRDGLLLRRPLSPRTGKLRAGAFGRCRLAAVWGGL
jgi:hypothetical protein